MHIEIEMNHILQDLEDMNVDKAFRVIKKIAPRMDRQHKADLGRALQILQLKRGVQMRDHYGDFSFEQLDILFATLNFRRVEDVDFVFEITNPVFLEERTALCKFESVVLVEGGEFLDPFQFHTYVHVWMGDDNITPEAYRLPGEWSWTPLERHASRGGVS